MEHAFIKLISLFLSLLFWPLFSIVLFIVPQNCVEELDCSKCESLTEHAFLKLISLDLLPKLRRLVMPVLPSGPTSGDKLFSALASVCPALEEVENIHPNIFDDVDPYKCQVSVLVATFDCTQRMA
jgi:hypothetical protein